MQEKYKNILIFIWKYKNLHYLCIEFKSISVAKQKIYKQEEIFFTSDTHFFHKSVIDYCERPFESLEHMNQELINRWNSVVTSNNQTVVIGGDFAFTGNIELIKELLSKLNGKKILILGNHCLRNKYDRDVIKELFEGNVFHQHLIYVEDADDNEQQIFISHYPCIAWAGKEKGSWHCFGHVHSRANDTGSDSIIMEQYNKMRLKSYDIGVDNNDFTPISYSQLKSKIFNK